MALPDVVGFAAALVAVVTAASIVRGLFRRTMGARWVAQRRVEALAAGARHAYFVEQLGEPALERRQDDAVEYVFVSRWYYIQSLEYGGVVVEYFVTLRTRFPVRFGPALTPRRRFRRPGLTLGGATFLDFGAVPDEVFGSIGARRAGYAEQHYFGNPGLYQTYFVALNDAAPGARDGDGFIPLFLPPDGPYCGVDLSNGDQRTKFLADPAVGAFRRIGRPNTFGVRAPLARSRPLEAWVGVDLDHVRVLP